MSSWVLKNAVVVNEGRCAEADVGIVDGRIERIGGQVAITGARELDLAGAWLLPGMIVIPPGAGLDQPGRQPR